MSSITHNKRSPGRPSAARDSIVAYLRDNIVSGRWRPGAQLPTRAEIEERFSAGPVTVQRALDSLARDGFVTARGSRGTFVAELPPHLTRIGILFASDPKVWNRYWLALHNEAQKVGATLEGRTLAFYCGVDGRSDSEDYQRLLRDLEARRIAGLIFTSCPAELRGTPVVDAPGIARVAWSGGREYNVPGVNTNGKMWIERAIEHLKSKGRRRVAMIIPPCDDREAQWLNPLAEAGMEVRPYWIQSIHLRDSVNAFYLAQLLVRCDDKPDALLIADDNLVERTTAGLLAAGIRVPEDLEILAHCNYPWQPETHLPAQFLGFDVRRVLNACLDNINLQFRHEAVPQLTLVPAEFAEEVPL